MKKTPWIIFLVLAVVINFIITYKWLNSIDSIRSARNLTLYTLYCTLFTTLLVGLVFKIIQLKPIRIVSYFIVGFIAGDIIEQTYRFYENKTFAIKYIEVLSYHLITMFNLCWLQALILGFCCEFLSYYFKKCKHPLK